MTLTTGEGVERLAEPIGQSPFPGAYTSRFDMPEAAPVPTGVLESPFGVGLQEELLSREEEAAAELLEALQDEDFDDALEMLVDEAASRALADMGAWSAAPSETEAWAELEEWISPLATASEQALEDMADRLASADLLGMTSAELDGLLAPVTGESSLGSEAFDQFLGGWVNKATSLVRKAADLGKKGLATAARVLPASVLLNKLKGLVRPLLHRVLAAAMSRLPASVRPIAKTLAAKLGVGETADPEAEADHEVAALAESFDIEATALLFAPDAQEELAEYAPSEAVGDGRDRFADLDDARMRLGRQLTELPAGTPPIAEIESFIPPTLAIRPLVKLGMSVVGRDRVIRFIADRIASLIKGMVGTEAARAVSRPIVDVGLRMLGFEVPADEEPGLAGEALASTVESTVLRLADLPAGAFEDELQLDAAVQQAFAEAAAAFLPDRMLRADLPERETAGEGGVWVLMPRATRPRFKFRRFSRTFQRPVSRQIACTVPWSDGGTLETYLVDSGAEQWPVQAEIDLYEAIPGTHIGHFSQDDAVSAGSPRVGEFEYLTPEIAGLLLGEPGLGRRPSIGGAAKGRPRPTPGGRYFRVRAAAQRRKRPRRRRVLVRLEAATGRLRVIVRLSERQAQQILAKLERATPAGQRDLPSVLRMLKDVYGRTLPAVVAGRLIKHSVVARPGQARTVADRIVAGVTAGLSRFLTSNAAQLVAAIQEPANGVTITVAQNGLTKEGLGGGELPAASVGVRAGWQSA